jgi:AraC-like DNA-binding protein
MSRLLHLHRAAEQLGKGTPDILSNTEVGRALEQALMHAMIAYIAQDARAQIGFSSHHHSAIIARFEELLAANSNRPLYLAEICAAVGASETTLRVSCHEHLGMGPLRYLWLRRMHLVRRALLTATPETTTVTEIALDHGFWELGRFSVEYGALFGETPSESLRRAPIDRQSPDRNPFVF